MNLINLYRATTNLADQAVLLPLSAAVAATLAFQWKRGAIAWIIGMGLTIATIIVSKIICYIVVGNWPFNIGLKSPSAHAAAGAAVYGSLLALMIGRGQNGLLTSFICSALIAVYFSVTRLELGVHTRSEVIIGSMMGILGAVTIAYLAGHKDIKFSPIPLMVCATIIIGFTYGTISHGEDVIASVSHKIKTDLKQRFE